MKFISLFAGIGGFDLALERAGHQCVYANDFDKYASKIYEKNFQHPIDTRDIKVVDANEIPEHDILVGGFPCQSFSIAGKRRGFTDTRGTLFFEIARIIDKKRPRLFILENVKGLLSHDEGRTLRTIIDTLDELGYDLQWQVLNSKDFGVPQNRERIYIVGNLRGTPRPQVFPIGEIGEIPEKSQRETRQTTATALRAKQGGPDIDQTYITVLTKDAEKIKCGKFYPMRWVRTEDGKEARRKSQRENGKDYTPFNGIYRTLELAREKKQIGCLTRAINKDSLLGNGIKIRRLTPVECERLQGFPDRWTEGVSDTQRYKCLGNAVTVNVVEAIVNKL